MASLTKAELNLLQERRQELGRTAQPALMPQLRSLLGKGIGLGALLVLAVVAVAAWLAWQESQQQVELDRLQPLEQQLRLEQTQLQQLKARTAVIRKENT
ncbi:MAG: pilus assembly protein PilP, partial [Prochlorococcus sp. ALOHA_A2.0_51]|nr:pilus assembly protein PilP [Prochlorococcus sp. ALOHA_A2.0_51]